MRRQLNNLLWALPGLLAAIDKWAGRAMDLIGLPAAAEQIREWLNYFPNIGDGTYFLIGFSVIGLLVLNLWPRFRTDFGLNIGLNIWATRDRLELYEIACRAVGAQPRLPVNRDPQLSLHRYLRDAIFDGRLTSVDGGTSANVHTQVQIDELEKFAQVEMHPQLKKLVRDWGKGRRPAVEIGWKFGAPALAIVFVVGVIWYFAESPIDCTPKFEWRPEITFGDDSQVPNQRFAARHLVLTRKVESAYKMIISGFEGGLLNLNAVWRGMKKSDVNKREENGIILTLYDPVGVVSILITPENMGDTDLKIQFKCMKDGTR